MSRRGILAHVKLGTLPLTFMVIDAETRKGQQVWVRENKHGAERIPCVLDEISSDGVYFVTKA
jgi:hypothetical protein